MKNGIHREVNTIFNIFNKQMVNKKFLGCVCD